MNLKNIYIFLLYGGALALLAGAMLDWLESADIVPIEMMINAWNIAIKRISTGVIGLAGGIMVYVYNQKQMLTLPVKKKYALLLLIMGAVALLIVITGVVPEDKELYYQNGPGFMLSLVGAMAFVLGAILQYFHLRLLLKKENRF